ncbi:unnamed protein product [Staurois parvus]|uniref:Uncharacterized protein n=1 Tax=Staurois parvus TaxID=386267 RepID=A0ABN9GTY2_9NEOB|nr:unnamed protein product [Staurois parvus]
MCIKDLTRGKSYIPVLSHIRDLTRGKSHIPVQSVGDVFQ